MTAPDKSSPETEATEAPAAGPAADNPADLTAPIKTVQEAATGFSADVLDWVQNSTLQAALVLIVLIGVVLGLQILRRGLLYLVTGKPGKPRTRISRIAFRLIRSTSAIFVSLLGCWLVAQFIYLPKGVVSGLSLAFMIAGFIQVGLWLREIALMIIERRLSKQGASEDETALGSAIGVIGWLVNLAVWSIILLALLDNLGVNITALVAGLGIGGLAVGLAAQGIMADLFSALSIVFDKPFSRGDFIAFNDKMGTVEKVGLKTSRLRALTGEILVVANNQLLTNVIHNHQQLVERRIVFSIRIVNTTPPDVIEAVPDLLRKAVAAQPNCRFDRAHFNGFKDGGISFEIVYFYLSRDYNAYMDAQQSILLRIMRSLAEHGIKLDFPARTIQMVS